MSERSRWPDPRAPFTRTCRGCGCTDLRACPGGCSWVLLDIPSPTGVCSECAWEVEWDVVSMAVMGTEPLLKEEARAILRASA